MFSAFFGAYAVLAKATAGGPSRKDLFHTNIVAIETACLLLSSFTCGFASVGARARSDPLFYGAMALTALLGAGFLFLEIREFHGMIAAGAGPTRSPFLSAFFSLVGCHGLHVTLGLAWLLTMMAQPRCSPRATAPTSCAACSASPCSGTRWTSSGSGSSPWFN